MKKLLCSASGFLVAATAFGAGFAPGDLVITRVGDGSAALGSSATALFLDEYTPSGTWVQTIAMPTAAIAGGNQVLTIQGSATSEGNLQLSGNGQYLTLGGYNAVPGTATPSGSTAATVNRVIGLVGVNDGSVNTTTALSSGTAGAFRSVSSDDGTHFWASSGSGGVGYVAAVGATSATQLSTTPSNTRITHALGGQLYVSSASGSFQGVSSIGSGLPTASGQTTAILPGFPTASGPSPYEFYISGNSAWVADDRSAASGGGLQKWTLNNGTWTLQYTIGRGTVGDRGLTADFSGANPTFYVTTTDNKIDQIVDGGTLASSTLQTMFTDGTANTAFRGVAFIPNVPEPSSAALAGLGLLMAGLLRRRQ